MNLSSTVLHLPVHLCIRCYLLLFAESSHHFLLITSCMDSPAFDQTLGSLSCCSPWTVINKGCTAKVLPKPFFSVHYNNM